MFKQISGQADSLSQFIAKVLSHSVRAATAPGQYGGRLPSSVIRLYEYGVRVVADPPALRSAFLMLLEVDGLVILPCIPDG